jgi:hypothetical protein
MADERFGCSLLALMLATSSDKVSWRNCAISRKPSQNASSTLTPVLRPAMTMHRLMTEDFMTRFPKGAGNVRRFRVRIMTGPSSTLQKARAVEVGTGISFDDMVGCCPQAEGRP